MNSNENNNMSPQNYNPWNNQNNNQQNYNPWNNQNNNQPVNNTWNNQQVNNTWNNQNNMQPNYGMYYNQPKKDNKLKIVLVILLVVLVGCVVVALLPDKKKSSPHTNTDYERTILIYMVGANLESSHGYATSDLNGIDYEKLNKEGTKVLLIAGGSKSWKNSYINVNETSIYELTDSGYKVVKKQDKKNMGESKVLSEFLNYGFDNYKSKKYDLLFWNHGLGVLGSEHDEIADDFLDLSEMKKALNDSKFSSTNKLELVLFRTCLNGTIEVADTLKDFSEYMVASQEITYGYDGNNLLQVLNNIKRNDNGKEIGKKFSDGYMDYIKIYQTNNGYANIYSTYSVLDLSNINNLENALGTFFNDINVTNNYAQIARIRTSLRQYGSEEPTYDSIDLYNLIYDMKSLSPSNAQKVLDELNNTIVYNKSTDSKSKGLSIYFPYKGSKEAKNGILNKFYKFNGLDKYKAFITSFNGLQNGSTPKLNFADNNVFLSKANTNSDFELELTDEQKESYNSPSYIVFRDNKDGTYLPVYGSSSVKVDSNKLKANIKDRQLKVIDTRDNSSNIISLIEEEETDDYIKYSTYSTIQKINTEDASKWVIETAKINIVLDKKTNKIKLDSAFVQDTKKDKNSDSLVELPYSIAVNVNDYDIITFASSSYKVLDSDGNYNKDWKSNGIIKGIEVNPKKLKFELQDYNNSYDYYAVFKINDVYNNSYYSKLVKMK